MKQIFLIALLLCFSRVATAQREPDSFLTVFQAGIPAQADFFLVLKNQDHLRLSGAHQRRFEGAIPLLQFYANRLSAARLPTAYSVIPIVESGNLPTAISPVGAVGVWQLMPDTARRYGLRVDGYEDERYLIQPATQAAIQYLEYLHSLFDHPVYILAAYNWGEQNVIRLKKETKSLQAFVQHPKLPIETKQYLERIYALWLNIYQLNFQHPLHRYPNVPYFEIDLSRQVTLAHEQLVYQFVNPILNRNRDRLSPTEHFFKYFQSTLSNTASPKPAVKESIPCAPWSQDNYQMYVVQEGDTHQKIIQKFRIQGSRQRTAIKKIKLQSGLIIKIPFPSDPQYAQGVCR